MKYFRILFIMAVIFELPFTLNAQWINLIGKDLSNWEQLNGTAPFILQKNVIIGKTVVGSPNSFLCTKEKFGDFILEFDTWFDPHMNSGVQIRSESRSDYQNGRVHGYQIEMDPSERAWSGGIYDEARRGWLYSLDRNPEGKKALKVGEWNHYRVEAVGNSIRTWINGIPCADLVDDMTPSGFIALQVHSIGKDSSRAGLEVKWKNIKIITKNLDKYRTPYSHVIPQVSFLVNKLTEREKAEGWRLLFDGETSNGWINARTGKFPESGWEIKNGELIINPASKKPGGGGNIVTVDKFTNFELIVDFKYTKGANSGIKYFVDTESEGGKYASIGCEYQILDDRNHPDAKASFQGNRTLAGLYDLIPPKNKRDNGFDQWNRALIVVNGNKVQHWLNDNITVEYERDTPEWKGLVEKSKFKGMENFGLVKEGRILLQDHGNSVSFRNIKIREIKGF
ncbi:MAG: 3-keto-disaccharide hydrolase [Bacteroidales bacterium]